MTQVEIPNAARDRAGGYKVDVTRGERVGRISSEWFSRPADERYLSLSELFAAAYRRTLRRRTRTVDSAAIREASRDGAERMALMLPGSDAPIAPTHWSFGQLASLVSAPATYLRQLPAPLAGINLQYGLTAHRAEQIKTLEMQTAASSCGQSLAPTMAGFTTTNLFPPYSASQAMKFISSDQGFRRQRKAGL